MSAQKYSTSGSLFLAETRAFLWRSLDVLQAQRTDLVPLQPLVDAAPVKAMATWKPTQHAVPLELAQAHCAASLLSSIQTLWRVLDELHRVNELLAGSSGLRSCLLALEARREGVIEDDERHQKPCHSCEDHGQGQPIQSRTWPAVSGIQEPDYSQDEPAVSHDGDHLASSPGC